MHRFSWMAWALVLTVAIAQNAPAMADPGKGRGDGPPPGVRDNPDLQNHGKGDSQGNHYGWDKQKEKQERAGQKEKHPRQDGNFMPIQREKPPLGDGEARFEKRPDQRPHPHHPPRVGQQPPSSQQGPGMRLHRDGKPAMEDRADGRPRPPHPEKPEAGKHPDGQQKAGKGPKSGEIPGKAYGNGGVRGNGGQMGNSRSPHR